MCNFYALEGDTKVCKDTKIAKEKFDYEQEVAKYMENALINNYFEVYYQPIYSIEENKYVSIEALSRLKHPVLGWISPEIFIRIAEENGLLLRLTILQMKKICEFVDENSEKLKDIKTIKINLSYMELADYMHINRLLKIIASYEIPYNCFQFEVTETTATKYTRSLLECAEKFKEVGIDVCMDDFGTGYANLSKLCELPFKIVKIDRTLVKDIVNNDNTFFMYKNIVEILKKFGFITVAEGVETAEEVKQISDIGVDMIQGFYFSKPLSSEEIVEFLNK